MGKAVGEEYMSVLVSKEDVLAIVDKVISNAERNARKINAYAILGTYYEPPVEEADRIVASSLLTVKMLFEITRGRINEL